MRRITYGLLFAFAACTNSASGIDDVDVDGSVTIRQGVYGLLFTSSDVADVPDAVTPDKPLAVYRVTTAAELLTAATSNGDGVYQLELSAGRYELCVNGFPPDKIYDQWIHNCAGPCTFVDLADGVRFRTDWGANLSGGWWSEGDHCPRR